MSNASTASCIEEYSSFKRRKSKEETLMPSRRALAVAMTLVLVLVPFSPRQLHGAGVVTTERFMATSSELVQTGADLQKLLVFFAREKEGADTFNRLVQAGNVGEAQSYLRKVASQLGLKSNVSLGILSLKPAIRITLNFGGATLTVEFRWD